VYVNGEKYITNEDKRFQTYVANRIAIIHGGSDKSQWNYVDTKANPADEVSRGQAIDQFLENTRWTDEPDFLWKSKEYWPIQPKIQSISVDDLEVKASIFATVVTHAMPSYFEKYSTWYKLKRIMSRILCYKKNLLKAAHDEGFKKKVYETYNRRKSSCQNNLEISVELLIEAEKEILKIVQHHYYSREIEAAKNPQKNMKFLVKSSLRKLDPILLDGLLCFEGRLDNAKTDVRLKHQLILPKSHYRTGFSGREYVLAEVRQKFWVTKGNSFVREVL